MKHGFKTLVTQRKDVERGGVVESRERWQNEVEITSHFYLIYRKSQVLSGSNIPHQFTDTHSVVIISGSNHDTPNIHSTKHLLILPDWSLGIDCCCWRSMLFWFEEDGCLSPFSWPPMFMLWCCGGGAGGGGWCCWMIPLLPTSGACWGDIILLPAPTGGGGGQLLPPPCTIVALLSKTSPKSKLSLRDAPSVP